MPGDGFLNLLKPPGMTSHEAVAHVRAGFRGRRAGHLGTLDPAAAGVLPVALGRATRLFQFAGGADKAYRAEITFGITTDTLDAEGEAQSVCDSAYLTEGRVRDLLRGLLGEIEQMPPAYSALHVGGRRLHELAREGRVATAAPRRVSIASLDLAAFSPGPRARAVVDVVCSPGTYVRSLAADVGRASGCGALLSFLVRTRVGRFTLADSYTLEELDERCAASEQEALLLSLDWPLQHLPSLTLGARQAESFRHGRRLLCRAPAAPFARAHGPEGRFLGLGEVLAGGQLIPRLVLSDRREDDQ